MTRSARTALWAGAASAATVLTLRPLVVSSGWLVPALGMVCAVTGAGLVVRALFRRAGLAVAAQLLVVLVVLLVLFGGGTTLLAVLPTPRTVERLVQLFGDGVQVVQRYSVPAVDLRGLRLLLVAGAGLVAFAVDVFAVTLRRPALAGLPLLVVMAVPLALAPGGSSGVAFLLAGVPFLVLLANERRGTWPSSGTAVSAGREPAGRRPGRSVAGVTASATAAMALVAAVAVPAAVPGLDERPLTIDTGPSDTIAVINPILNLKASLGARSDATILTYTTDEDDPAPLRIVTADVFDGETWAPSTGADIPRSQRVQDGLTPAPGLSDVVRDASRVQTTSISIRGLDQTYLPLPYPSLRVDIAGEWLYETDSLNVVGDGETTRGRQYTVTHLEVSPTESQLRSAPAAPDDVESGYTELPGSLPQSVRDTAVQVTAGASDDYERAAALQRYFRSTGGFTYSTTAPNDGGSDAVASFLVQKSGFCVQFASAMAVMARSLGIPARVAIGFLPGDEGSDGRWRISAQDAHAWPELYFQGVGWVRFEPTPATRTGTSPAWTVPVTPLPTAAPSSSAPPSAVGPSEVPTATTTSPTSTASEAAGQDRPTGWDRVLALPWGWIAAAVLVVVVLLAPRLSATVLGRRRWTRVRDVTSSAEAAWADLEDRVHNLGLWWAPSTTPRQRAAALSEFTAPGSPAAQELQRMRAAVEDARFGVGSPSQEGRARSGGDVLVDRRAQVQTGRLVRAQVDVVVEAVAASRPRWLRWRARAFPMAGVRRGLDWWDRD